MKTREEEIISFGSSSFFKPVNHVEKFLQSSCSSVAGDTEYDIFRDSSSFLLQMVELVTKA
ncbi:MAG: hypothetical protein KAU17_06875 [Spirochaetales bacterium]|nr:hypothetical protein [Spirochaetales bacterium]